MTIKDLIVGNSKISVVSYIIICISLINYKVDKQQKNIVKKKDILDKTKIDFEKILSFGGNTRVLQVYNESWIRRYNNSIMYDVTK